jgi:NAD(P) transhydrogenase subunit alpha
MKVGILKESDEPRVAITPAGCKALKSLGLSPLVEGNSGALSGYLDAEYAEFAEIADRSKIFSESDILISINPLSLDEYKGLKKDALFISMFAPYLDDTLSQQLLEAGYRTMSLDMIPRITIAQSMDVLSSMASIAGYKAVLIAADTLDKYMPMMMTAAGTVKPAKVVILGAGVAGLQAIATARRLGAVVEVSDPRTAVKEEVKSLGGRFIEIEGAVDDSGAGGYAVEQSEEFLKRQRELVQQKSAEADIVITTAQVRGRKAPMLLPKETVEKMRSGSVIVDLAASTGGNCAFTENGKTIQHNGVTIIGDSDLSASMPRDASMMFSNNIISYMKQFIVDGQLNLDLENEIINSSLYSKPEQNV